MDTRFWGPDGWKLLHSITANYPNKPTKNEKDNYYLFFNSLQYVLPCIYCRRSLTQYMNEIPIKNYLDNKYNLVKWLYLIHNKVNNKLRMQNLNTEKDPLFHKVEKKYQNYLIEINNNNCINMPGWDFIYTIIFNFPLNYSELTLKRYFNYIIFFKYLGKILPFITVKDEYLKLLNDTNLYNVTQTRTKFIKWFYSFEKKIKKIIDCKCIEYDDRCNLIEKQRAGCGKGNDLKPTCRVNNNLSII